MQASALMTQLAGAIWDMFKPSDMNGLSQVGTHEVFAYMCTSSA